MKKVLKIIGISLGSLLSLFLVVILCLVFSKTLIYKEFFSRATKTDILIPGLKDDYCQQGLAYSSEYGTYFFCGYMTNGEASRIYIENETSKDIKYVNLINDDGSAFLGHVGGMATEDNKVWVASSNKAFTLNIADLLNADNASNIKMNTYFEAGNHASCAFADSNYLYIGEFHDGEKYVTDASHYFEVGEKEINHSLVFAYPINLDSQYGVDVVPSFAYSVLDQVQGVAVGSNDDIYLSCSYSIKSSRLHTYKKELTTSDNTYSFNGTDVPVYYLNHEAQVNKVNLMPMSEDLDYDDGKVLIGFESACRKYKIFNIYPTKNVYSYNTNND